MAVCPAPLPLTVKFKGFAVVEVRLVTVIVLDCPAEIVAGLKLQVAALLQESAMVLRKVLGAAAEIVKVVVLEPMRTTFDRALEDSVNTGLPVPERLREVVGLAASDWIWTLPVTLPVLVGVKLTEMVQDCPTFRVAGTVGKLGPQLLVCAKPPKVRILVMVTA